MTLGYGPPRAKCPHCATEGTVDENQMRQNKYGNGRTALSDTIRFICPDHGRWTVPAEDAMLMGAFLDRQDALN